MLNEWKIGLEGFAVGFWQSMRAMIACKILDGRGCYLRSKLKLYYHPLADIAGI